MTSRVYTLVMLTSAISVSAVSSVEMPAANIAAMKIADRVMIMNNGRIVFDGSRYPVSLHTSYLERDNE